MNRNKSGLRIDFDGETVTAYSTWLGPVVPRTSPPMLTPAQVADADSAARALFAAEPGELIAHITNAGVVYTKPVPANAGRVV